MKSRWSKASCFNLSKSVWWAASSMSAWNFERRVSFSALASSWSFSQSSMAPLYSISNSSIRFFSISCFFAKAWKKAISCVTTWCWDSSCRVSASLTEAISLETMSRHSCKEGRTSALMSSVTDSCSPHSWRASWISSSKQSELSIPSALMFRASLKSLSSCSKPSKPSCMPSFRAVFCSSQLRTWFTDSDRSVVSKNSETRATRPS
mmetsp:Transcript_47694/g.102173  ORF Transcript_47694/g.102173 Transcript_47694/m.102173 type:complete len:207 (-) Transcript_47694:999-1619(-)